MIYDIEVWVYNNKELVGIILTFGTVLLTLIYVILTASLFRVQAKGLKYTRWASLNAIRSTLLLLEHDLFIRGSDPKTDAGGVLWKEHREGIKKLREEIQSAISQLEKNM